MDPIIFFKDMTSSFKQKSWPYNSIKKGKLVYASLISRNIC